LIVEWENDPALWIDQIPSPSADGNKTTRGHSLAWGGYPATGAARMAARAAARIGSGLTTIAMKEHALPIYAAALESIMVAPIAADADFAAMVTDPRYSAFLIGPGAGIGSATRAYVFAVLQTARPVVLDADALTSFANDSAALFTRIAGPCVLTPHAGEFIRLFGHTGDVIDAEGSRMQAAREAARLSGAIVVFKGSRTVIAAPDGRVIVNTNAPAFLATAGAGDVLSGMVLGLLAQGMDAFLASAAAVWMHGAAASQFGMGLIAEDLPDQLPAVLQQLARATRSIPPHQ
jgi:ADP-dependent NAD(P)H-hydrate dehydratase / NAD(P)H-hydrate epimerase